jgi:hypothetical protein
MYVMQFMDICMYILKLCSISAVIDEVQYLFDYNHTFKLEKIVNILKKNTEFVYLQYFVLVQNFV